MAEEGSTTQESDDRLLHAQDLAAWHCLRNVQLKYEVELLRQSVRIVEESVSFRLGAALVSAARSPRELVRLPGRLLALLRDLKRRGAVLPQEVPAKQEPYPPAGDVLRYPQPLPERLRDLRVAVVMDQFSLATFAPECVILELEPEGIEAALDGFKPHLLLVESAWRGRDGKWRNRIHPVSFELRYLVDCCRRRGVRTAFWNKEDPSHFLNFIDAARLFDHVFTTDENCVPRYREALGHDRVDVLAFGAQPRIHNPIEVLPRKAGASFAGSWYQQYPERCRDFSSLVDVVGRLMPIDIYDRNADRGDSSFEFPSRFRPMIRGTLPYGDIARAYKGYEFSLTVNTIQDSPTMLARRVYELMCSNTIVVSNPSKALSRYFPGLLLVSDEAGFSSRLCQLRDDADARWRLRLRALREVLSRHDMSHRLETVASSALGYRSDDNRIAVRMFARASSLDEAQSVLASFRRQAWKAKSLCLLVKDRAMFESALCEPDVLILGESPSDDECADALRRHQWFGFLDPRDYYGEQYLTDLALATRYSEVDVVGKARRFATTDGNGPKLIEGVSYSLSTVALRCCLASASLGPVAVAHWLSRLAVEVDPEVEGLAVDQYNYCKDGEGHAVEAVDVA